jgi:hypothetical protein
MKKFFIIWWINLISIISLPLIFFLTKHEGFTYYLLNIVYISSIFTSSILVGISIKKTNLEDIKIMGIIGLGFLGISIVMFILFSYPFVFIYIIYPLFVVIIFISLKTLKKNIN